MEYQEKNKEKKMGVGILMHTRSPKLALLKKIKFIYLCKVLVKIWISL